MGGRVQIRPVTLQDVPQLTAVHAGSDGPWVDPVEGAIWIYHRLGRPFMIDVAALGDILVGHAEWIVGDERGFLGRQLYLAMLQVHPDYRGLGIGRAMVEHGHERARQLSCRWVRVLAEGGAEGFYRKCGFRAGAWIDTYDVPVQPADWPAGWQRTRSVPKRAVRTLPMRLGWVQASSTFMWELCNRPVRLAGEQAHHPCARRTGDGAPAYVQLRHLGAFKDALVLAWGQDSEAVHDYLPVGRALAQGLPVDTLSVVLPEAEATGVAEMGQLVGREALWELAVTP
jgi:GNAT superfamily N-acetyltransferase